MELSQLKYFMTVAKTGKISQAAESLFISAPALSASISRLEKELGMPLFDRTNNRIILNEQGQIFLRYVTQIFSNLEWAKTELQQSIMRQNQHIFIASVASTPWVDMITDFSQEYPHFTLSCTSTKRSELINGLPSQYSFLLATEEDIPAFYIGELESIKLFEEHPLLMLHKDHPLASESAISLADIIDEPIYLPMRDYTPYDHVVNMFETAGIPFPAGNAYSHLMMQHMVAKGLGVGFSTLHTGRTPLLPIKYIPIKDAYIPWNARLYWRKNHIFTEDELVFKSFVENYFQTFNAL